MDSQRYTFSPIPDMWVYFKKPAGWATPIKIYYWSVAPTGAAATVTWPGINATQVCPGGDWWAYKFSGVSSVNIIFDDGTGKQTLNLTNVTTTTYFDYNTPLTTIPDISAPVGKLTATPSTGTAPLTVNFDASTSTGCTVLGFFWNFGDSTYLQSGLNGTATETYTKPGTYYMNVIVQDQNNKRDTVKQTIVVTANATGMTIHLKPATTWTSKPPYFYYWASLPTAATDAWPGVAMTNENNGWYKYTLTGDTCTSLIFNNNTAPQSANLSHCGDGWYDGTIPAWVTNPLPVKLINFYGNIQDKKTVLNWTIADEINMKGYSIERSAKGDVFTTTGFVAATEYLSGNKTYSFTDYPTSNGVWYYRLKIINNNGSFSYSNVVALKVTDIGSIVAYPNPVQEQLFIQNSLLNDGKYVARISDMMGKEIIRKEVYFGINQTQSININRHIATGLYLLQLMDKDSKPVYSQPIQINQ